MQYTLAREKSRSLRTPGTMTPASQVQILPPQLYENVAEWLKATVLKTVDPRGSVGSNPTIFAISAQHAS